ncbi:MAG: glycoside hydrolase family 13 protein [Dermatophilaceae bacterium]
MAVASNAWWRHAVIYQVYPRSWSDADGDGHGDLPGIIARLPYLTDLGVDALWLSPFYVSPQHDAGYDVADYRDVDPLFGTLADADALMARAHELGLRVIIDLVPNHTSSEHAWFREALGTSPGSEARARYLFRDGRGPDGALPPNNWRSVFGGRAWSRLDDGQWYLHLFDATQPDLDWTNPQVRVEFEDILRFWLDRGVDGFRVDVAHGLVKAPGLPDWGAEQEMLSPAGEGVEATHPPMWDQEGVHDIYRSWRRITGDYDPDTIADASGAERILVAEAWVDPVERAARYVRPGEMHQAFNFAFLTAAWTAPALRAVIEESLRANDAVGAPTTWVLSNHDVVRHATRLGLPGAGEGGRNPHGVGVNDPQPDTTLGLSRARAATALMLALPGAAYVYQGEELGLPEHTTLPDDMRQDPTYVRSAHAELGRDGCRIPIPWESTGPALGFNRTGRLWLPQPASYAALAVDAQHGVAGSTLELYRRLLRVRRDLALGRASLAWLEGYGPDVVALRSGSARGPVAILANLGAQPVGLPEGELLAASGPLEANRPAGPLLPADTTAWVALPT